MSDPSDSAHPAPDPSAPLPSSPEPPAAQSARHGTDSPADEPSAAEQSPAEPSRRAPIRIGTQRSGVKVPVAVPKPVLPAPPPELLARAHATALGSSDTPSGETPAPATESAENVPQAGQAESDQPESTRPERPRGKPPSTRKARVAVVSEPLPARKYPPPNLRAQLSAEEELEYMEALGGQSLDEIIAGETGEVDAELELESRHQAQVVTIHRDDVFVEIGGHHQGVISLQHFAVPPEPGALVDVVVIRFDAAEGLYELALPGAAVDVGDWSEVSEGMVVEARVTGHNKGGLECEVNRLRGFIPASQTSLYRVEDLAQFVDQKFPCIVTEVNPEKRNLVLSRRAVLEREKAEAKEQVMASLEVGQTREGVVRSLQNFGAFVDLGGVDGLIHISQLSWDRIKHAEEVLQLGQKVKVKIQRIDPQTGKIGLTFRDLSESPWENVAQDFPTRTPVKGRVTRVTDFGAFVRLGPGVEGLVHISELSHKRVFRVTDVLTEGQEVEVMVLSVDAEAQRIGLSLKALEAKPSAARAAEPDEPEPPRAPVKRKTPLKGGIGGPPTGDKFGLKW